MSICRKCLFLVVITSVSTLFGQTIKTANVTFTTIDVPGAAITSVSGINKQGEMAGYYADSSNGPGTGFLFSGGTFSFFNYPSSDSTLAFGINDFGLISGTAYTNGFTGAVGFLYDGTVFTNIQARGKSATIVYGINNAGVVVGGDGTLSATKGFELVGTRFHTLSPPGSFFLTFGTGINNVGGLVGTTEGSTENGFSFKSGKFRTISVPGASLTAAWGMNDNGIIVGTDEAGPPYAFFGFAMMNGKYVSIKYPDAMDTYVTGINNAGQIVGSYTFDQQTFHGFVTSQITEADFQ